MSTVKIEHGAENSDSRARLTTSRDLDAIERSGRILDSSDSVSDEFSGWFCGKTSPIHLFWDSFELAVTRFSGRPAPPITGDAVMQEAYSQKAISFGFWAVDDNVPDAATTPIPGPNLTGCATSRTRW